MRPDIPAALALLLASCGGVAVPHETYYRIDAPELGAHPIRSGDVLRVEGLDLDASLSSDRVLIADDAVQLRAYEFHRWLNPLDRMVLDTLVRSLSRSGAFQRVKGPTDDAGESLVLAGRVIDFHQSGAAGVWCGKVTMELRLTRASDGAALFDEEFTHSVAMEEPSPDAAVRALSRGTGEVLRQFLDRCHEAGVFRGFAEPGK